ncbi:J-domain-containing protein [Nocardia sp. NBC_00416]|uniref:DnaJ family domain-containing protein n=1 Tax=Nocardia sp. NBC_00416 TaxID=2975991 RepID=UPI002E1E6101
MSERKPAGVDVESWVDRKIREATERGEFENLPGAGKPLPGAGHPYHDENGWLRDYLRREGVSGDVMLPPSLLLRRDVERLPETVRESTSEADVRATVTALNRRIVDWLRLPAGPPVPLAAVDADEVVREWRAARSATAAAPTGRPDTGRAGSATGPRAGRWRRIFGGR